MKQKVVIKVTLNGKKKARSKAMQTAVGVRGVESVAFQGEDNDQIVVIGDSIDSVNLTYLLRKKVGFADILSLSPVDEKRQQKDMTEPVVQAMVWPTYQAGVPQYYYIGAPDNSYETCSIV